MSHQQQRWTRRKWAAVASSVPLLAAQTPSSPTESPEAQKKAETELSRIKGTLARIEVPLDIAPAFLFRP